MKNIFNEIISSAWTSADKLINAPKYIGQLMLDSAKYIGSTAYNSAKSAAPFVATVAAAAAVGAVAPHVVPVSFAMNGPVSTALGFFAARIGAAKIGYIYIPKSLFTSTVLATASIQPTAIGSAISAGCAATASSAMAAPIYAARKAVNFAASIGSKFMKKPSDVPQNNDQIEDVEAGWDDLGSYVMSATGEKVSQSI